MKSRWPLLLSLLPLLGGLAVYGQFWRGWAAGFETTLAGWFPGRSPAVSGFPYRLEAEVPGVKLARGGAVVTVDRLRLNRGPWRPELTVMQGQGVTLAAAVAGLAPRLSAAVGTASLKLAGSRLERFSVVLPAARGNAGIGPDFTAQSAQLHLREIEIAKPLAAARAQVVIAATGFRLGQGAPIDLDGDFAVRGAAPLRDYRRWAAAGGSVDAVLTGRDATGEIFKLDATLVPLAGGLRLAGTIVTSCPLAVQAALNGTPAPAELRLRSSVRLALETALPAGGPVAISGLPADLARRARRGQVPACPSLR